MKVWIDCVPSTTTAQGKRANFKTGHFYTDERELSWTEFLTGILAPHAPSEPLEGPLALNLTIVWPLNKGDENTKAKRFRLEECDCLWHDQKPDWDNAPKSLVDVMGKLGFFKDDKQIVRGSVTKLRGKKTGVGIEIEPVSSTPWDEAESARQLREEAGGE